MTGFPSTRAVALVAVVASPRVASVTLPKSTWMLAVPLANAVELAIVPDCSNWPQPASVTKKHLKSD